MRGENFRITQMFLWVGKIAMITIVMFIASIMMADAQRHTFVDAYLKLRQPENEDAIQITKLTEKDIQKLLAAPEPKGHTEKERQEYLRGKAILKNTRQISLVIDGEAPKGFLSSSQFNDLFSSYGSYEKLISMKMEDMRILFCANLKNNNKIKELFFLMSDVEDDALLFGNILLKKPVALKDYMGNSGDIRRLFSVNSSNKENAPALIKFNFSRSNPNPINSFSLLDNTLPSTLEVVQVDGKYGVQSTPNVWDRKYLIDPTYEIAPVIYGSNPGNSYIVVTFGDNGHRFLYDKFGFVVAHGDELSPVYVLGNEDEVAAFIIRDDHDYSLYECPETYAMRQDSLETEKIVLRPHTERRILNCQSIVPTEDERLKCVKTDGSTEFIPIRKQKVQL